METREFLEEKFLNFAVRIVKLYKYLAEDKKEYVISKQLLRCGTSIGANFAEAQYAISNNDFLAKTYIALKETNETIYWLKLLYRSEVLSQQEYESIYKDCQQLLKLLISITKKIKEK
ncbi:MAG: four helix bundle protein [Bacteroidales bacterium]|nr:four helix bundle protein [Bacteroidales bacterium]